MKKISFALIACSLLVLSCKKSKDETPQFSTLKDVADYYIQKAISDNEFIGVSLGVIQNGEVHTFYYGSKTKDGSEKPDSNTVFEIGSNTKTFTALLLAIDCLNGNVKLNDSINSYLPKNVRVKDYQGSPLEFFHLATHTGGFPHDPTNLVETEISPVRPYEGYTIEAFYSYLNSFNPTKGFGLQYEYSNVGFALIGHILNLMHETNYNDLVKHEIFDKLGMKNSYISSLDGTNNIAIGYSGSAEIPVFNMPDFYAGAGDIKSGLGDMIIYLKSQIGMNTTNLDSAILYCHEQTIAFGGGVYSGLAWGINDSPKGKIYFHDGGTPGQTSFVVFNKEQRNGVVLLTNTHNTVTTEVSLKIFEWIQGNQTIN
jgi:CubicO group peptidase (beta-lactamase class C family)